METVPRHFALFKVLSVLGFFSEGFSERTLEWESGVFGVVFLVTKMPVLRPENGKEKVLPVFSFFFYFCYGAFSRRVLGNELRDLYWMCFRWFRVRVFAWIYY